MKRFISLALFCLSMSLIFILFVTNAGLAGDGRGKIEATYQPVINGKIDSVTKQLTDFKGKVLKETGREFDSERFISALNDLKQTRQEYLFSEPAQRRYLEQFDGALLDNGDYKKLFEGLWQIAKLSTLKDHALAPENPKVSKEQKIVFDLVKFMLDVKRRNVAELLGKLEKGISFVEIPFKTEIFMEGYDNAIKSYDTKFAESFLKWMRRSVFELYYIAKKEFFIKGYDDSVSKEKLEDFLELEQHLNDLVQISEFANK